MKIGTLHVEIGAKIDNFEKNINKIGPRMEAVGQKLSSVGRKLTIGVTLPLAAIGGAAIKSAMQAQESENLFEVSMGKMAKAARSWSEEISKALGLNDYEVRQFVGTFNNMLVAMGLGERAAFDMAKGMTQLTYDLASFHNLKTDEAFNKLTSAISGEVEPMKRLGYVINETTIKQYALKTGMIEQGQVMTEQQKVVARFNLMMEQTNKVHGDMERTLGSSANQWRRLKAQYEKASVELGKNLLPAFNKLVGILNKATAWFAGLSDSSKGLVVKLGALTAALGPVLSIVGKLIVVVPKLGLALKALAGPIGIVVAAASALIVTLLKAKAAKEDLIDAAKREADAHDAVVNRIKAATDAAGMSERAFWKLYDAYDRNVAVLTKAIREGKEGVELQKAFIKVTKEHYEEKRKDTDITAELADITEGLANAMSGFGEKAKTTTKLLETELRQGLVAAGDNFGYFTGKVIDATEVLENARVAIANLPTEAVPAARDMANVLNNVPTELEQKFVPGMEKITETVKSKWTEVSQRMKDLWTRELGEMLAGAKSFSDGLSAIWDGIKRMFADLIAKMVVNWVHGFISKLLSGTKNMVSEIGGMAKDVVGGFKNIAQSVGGSLMNIGSAGIMGVVAGGVAGLVSGLLNKGFGKSSAQHLQQVVDATRATRDMLRNDYKQEFHVLQNVVRDVTGTLSSGVCRKLDIANSHLNNLIKEIRALPHAQHGGYFPRPTLAMIGEKEPEIVLPQSKIGAFVKNLDNSGMGGSGGGGQIVFHINALDGADVERVVERKIMPILDRRYRANYGGYARRLSEEVRKY